MDDSSSQQEQTEDQAVTPAEIWEQLSLDTQTRVVTLLAKMAYKCFLVHHGLLSNKTEKEVRNVTPLIQPQGKSDSP